MIKYLAALLMFAVSFFVISSIGVTGEYLGNLSANPHDPGSSSNRYGYRSPFDPDSINNRWVRKSAWRSEVSEFLPQTSVLGHFKKHGAGSPYRLDSPTKPWEGFDHWVDSGLRRDGNQMLKKQICPLLPVLRLIEVKELSESSGTILLTPSEQRVAEDRRDCYWLYIVTDCASSPNLQEPIKDPARLEWHEVKKVAYYWLEVDAMVKPMAIGEEPGPYGDSHA
jgi:hypothetical protein